MQKPKAPTGKTKKYYERLKKRHDNLPNKKEDDQKSYRIPRNLFVSPEDSKGSLTLSHLSEKHLTINSRNTKEGGQLIISGEETTIGNASTSHDTTGEEQNNRLTVSDVISLDGSKSLEQLLIKVRSEKKAKASSPEDLMQTIDLGQTRLVTQTSQDEERSEMSSYVSQFPSIKSGSSFAENEAKKKSLFNIFR